MANTKKTTKKTTSKKATSKKATAPTASNLTPQQAINVLIQGVQLGQKSGIFSFDDAVLIKQAIDVFVKPGEENKTGEAGTPAAAKETATKK